MGADALWDFGARRRPVEGLQHGHMVPTRGAHLFPPHPLLHALKHISRDIIKATSFQPDRMIIILLQEPGGHFQYGDSGRSFITINKTISSDPELVRLLSSGHCHKRVCLECNEACKRSHLPGGISVYGLFIDFFSEDTTNRSRQNMKLQHPGQIDLIHCIRRVFLAFFFTH